MSSPLRIGLVGAGFASRFHFEGYSRVYRVPVEVVGINDIHPEARAAFAQHHHIKPFTTLEELCNAADVIDICTPAATHADLAVKALELGKHVVVEKPFTGYYGPNKGDNDNFRGDTFPKEIMLREAIANCDRVLAAARKNGKTICYAENWIYAPAMQKEREILTKSRGQILWMVGDESHSGSHSPFYGDWRFSGGGSLMGKGCHPLSSVIHLKRVEGEARNGKPIRPATVSGHMHEITRSASFRDEGFLRKDYRDSEDYCQVHVTFQDGTVADIFASELVLGGVRNWLNVYANNHMTRCQISPIDAVDTYNPREELLKDVFVTEKIGTKQGWTHPSPDEDWQHGYPHEFQDFVESISQGRTPLSGAELARDTVAALYSAYLSSERNGRDVEVPIVD
ncbi:MAG TPA: Gfo/Idh/MocA family oxidoreductase [Candidatus Acidoferrales bacterium]|nr:Gfo/Idh/MocA family oxidoreductase [Candidatus Acidoferrales bacterium]